MAHRRLTDPRRRGEGQGGSTPAVWPVARRATVLLGATAGALLWGISGAAAQITSADPASWAAGGNMTATARGFGALAANPALLARADGPRWSLAIPGIQLRQALDPISLADLDRFSGRVVPEGTRRAWLDEINDRGGQRGRGRLELSGVSAQYRGLGIQISTVGLADVELSPDAAELLLFGNAGVDGGPRELDLAGSVLDLQLFTTLALAGARPLPWNDGAVFGGRLAVGAALKATVGHALVSIRDQGSLVTRDPVEVRLRIPLVQSDSTFDDTDFENGLGVGLDVGAAWERDGWVVGAALFNVFNTFRWNAEDFFFRPGEAFFNSDENTSDFDPRPLSEAPPALRRRTDALRFEPRLALGASLQLTPTLAASADVKRAFGDGILLEPRTHVGAGLRYRPVSWVGIGAGGAVLSGGYQAGGGATLAWGPLRLSGSWLLLRGDTGDGSLAAAGLWFQSR